MGVKITSKGDWSKTRKWLFEMKHRKYLQVLDHCAAEGVTALASATPKDSGLTASSWDYEIEYDGKGVTITWLNTNLAKGWFPVAIMLQYGHGTGTGGYVQGIDYINPAIRPVFDNISETVWEVVKGNA